MEILEVKDQIKLTLDTALAPLQIRSHWIERGDNIGEEYVVYNIISSPYVDYANDKPSRQRHHVDVAYYAPKGSLRQEPITQFKKAMLLAGWVVFTPEIPVPTLTKNKVVGIVIEFAKEQVIDYEQ